MCGHLVQWPQSLSRKLLPTNLPLLSRRLQLPVPLGVDFPLTSAEHVLRGDIPNRAGWAVFSARRPKPRPRRAPSATNRTERSDAGTNRSKESASGRERRSLHYLSCASELPCPWSCHANRFARRGPTKDIRRICRRLIPVGNRLASKKRLYAQEESKQVRFLFFLLHPTGSFYALCLSPEWSGGDAFASVDWCRDPEHHARRRSNRELASNMPALDDQRGFSLAL